MRELHGALQVSQIAVTGVNFFVAELTAKRLGLLHDLVPKAVRIAQQAGEGHLDLAAGAGVEGLNF